MANKSLTNDEYMKRIKNLYNDDFVPLSEYINRRSDVLIKHKCGYSFYAKAGYSMSGNLMCPVCDIGSTNLNTEVIKLRLKNKCEDEFILSSDYINSTTPIKLFHRKCGNYISVLWGNFEKSKCGCIYCLQNNWQNSRDEKYAKKIAKMREKELWLKENCIARTHPLMFNLLVDESFGYTHVFGTHEKTNFTCPNCGNIIKRKIGMPKLYNLEQSP